MIIGGDLVRGLLVASAWSGDFAYRRLYCAGVSAFLPFFHIPRRAALKKPDQGSVSEVIGTQFGILGLSLKKKIALLP
jgi:hypothetical protein